MTRRHARGVETIGRVIQRANLRVPDAIETSPVPARDWEAAVGTRIASRAKPVRLDRGVLLVRTLSSAWAQELSLLAEAILGQLRARGIAARSLRFAVGAVDPPARPATIATPRRAPRAAPLPDEVGLALAHVADDELRDAIAKAAARSLGFVESPAPPLTSERSDARGRRSAGSESDPPARTPSRTRGGRRGTP